MLRMNKRKCPTCNSKLKGKTFGYCSTKCKDTMLEEIKKAGYRIDQTDTGAEIFDERKTRNANETRSE